MTPADPAQAKARSVNAPNGGSLQDDERCLKAGFDNRQSGAWLCYGIDYPIFQFDTIRQLLTEL